MNQHSTHTGAPAAGSDDGPSAAPSRPGRLRALLAFGLPAVVFLLFIALVCAIGAQIFLSERAAIQRSAEDSLAVVARIKANAVSRWVIDRRGDAQALATNLAADQTLNLWLRDGARGTDGRGSSVRRRLQALDIYDSYRDVVLADPRGRPLLSAAAGAPTIDVATADLARETARTGRPAISRAYPVAPGGGAMAVDICAPVRVGPGRDAAVVAVVVLTIDGQRALAPLIDGWPGPSPSARTFLVTRNGDRVQFVTRPRDLSFSGPGPGVGLSSRVPAAVGARGVDAVMMSTDSRDVPVVAAATPVPGTPWGLVADIDAQEVFAPLGRLTAAASLTIGLLIGLASLVLLLAWRREQSKFASAFLEAETGHRRLEKEYEILYRHANDIILLIDPRGRIADANERAVDAYGLARNDLIGSGLRRLSASGANEGPANGSDDESDGVIFESVQKRADGSEFPVEISARRVMIEGEPWRKLIIRDITERLQAIEARARLATLIDHPRDGIMSLELDGKVLTWNAGAEDIYGYSAEEMIGQSFWVTVPGDRSDPALGAIPDFRAGGEFVHYEAIRIRKGGARIVVAVSVSPVRGPDGAVTGLFAIVRDITEQKRTERALAALSETTMAALRAADEASLCQRICEIVVDEGGYLTAEIALQAGGLDLGPIARAGPTTACAVALRLPLQSGFAEVGEIVIGLPDNDSFGPDETALLRKMAQDLAFGISALRDREARDSLRRSLEDSREESRRLNWALTAYVRSSTALMHADDAPDVMLRVCEDIVEGIVEDGAYPLALVGLTTSGTGQIMRIAAMAGSATDYLEGLRLTWKADAPESVGPLGRAIRSGSPVIIEDFAKDPSLAPWRERAASYGLACQVTVPLKQDNEVIGVLGVYASQTKAFGDKELDVFRQLSEEMVFAMSLEEGRRRLAFAEAERRKSDLRYRGLFESACDGILLASPLDGILEVNPCLCGMVGFARDDMIGHRAPEFMHPDDLPRDHEIGWLGDTYRGEIRFRRRDGTFLPTEVTATQDAEGILIAFVRDISDRRRAEEAERRADEAMMETRAELARFARIASLGEMVATISHEINQPLMAIQTDSAAALRWLNRESPRIDEVEAGLKRIGRNSERANGVIQRVRAFHVRDESIHAEFDLNQAVLEVVSLTRLEQRAADVEVEEDLAAGLGPAHGDRVQILQVIVNMLVNAIQALRPVSDRPRRITLRTRGDQSGMLRVQVEDNGVGLDPSIAGRLFEPYFTTRKGGTGLGLAISRSIIDSHRGRIWAEPAPDRGTVFQFTIPEAIRAPGDPPS